MEGALHPLFMIRYADHDKCLWEGFGCHRCEI